MTSRERMLAAIEYTPVDYIPCTFMLFNNLYNQCESDAEFVARQLELGLDPFVHVGHLNHTLHLYGGLHPAVKVREWVEERGGVKYFCRRLDTPAGPLTGRVKQWNGWPTEDGLPAGEQGIPLGQRPRPPVVEKVREVDVLLPKNVVLTTAQQQVRTDENPAEQDAPHEPNRRCRLVCRQGELH